MHRTKHMFWDHLPFWFVMACVVAFMAFDIWAMVNEHWIYSPERAAPAPVTRGDG